MANSTENLQAKEKIMDVNSPDQTTFRPPEKSIEEQKQESKFMFQFVSHEDGKRSEPFVGSWEAVNEILQMRKEGEKPVDEDFILLVAVLDGKETRIPGTPLITVKTFNEYHQYSETKEK